MALCLRMKIALPVVLFLGVAGSPETDPHFCHSIYLRREETCPETDLRSTPGATSWAEHVVLRHTQLHSFVEDSTWLSRDKGTFPEDQLSKKGVELNSWSQHWSSSVFKCRWNFTHQRAANGQASVQLRYGLRAVVAHEGASPRHIPASAPQVERQLQPVALLNLLRTYITWCRCAGTVPSRHYTLGFYLLEPPHYQGLIHKDSDPGSSKHILVTTNSQPHYPHLHAPWERPWWYRSQNQTATLVLSRFRLLGDHLCRAGHYVCYAKSASGEWRLYDDSRVTRLADGEETLSFEMSGTCQVETSWKLPGPQTA